MTTARDAFKAWLHKPIKHGKSLAETLDTPQKVIAENTWADAWYTATMAERERSALVCEKRARDSEEASRNSQYEMGCDDCAEDIRQGAK